MRISCSAVLLLVVLALPVLAHAALPDSVATADAGSQALFTTVMSDGDWNLMKYSLARANEPWWYHIPGPEAFPPPLLLILFAFWMRRRREEEESPQYSSFPDE